MGPSFQNRGSIEAFQVPSISCNPAALPEGCVMCVSPMRMPYIVRGISNGTSHLCSGSQNSVNNNSGKGWCGTVGTDPALCSVFVIPTNISLFCVTGVKAAFTTGYCPVVSVPLWGRGGNGNF